MYGGKAAIADTALTYFSPLFEGSFICSRNRFSNSSVPMPPPSPLAAARRHNVRSDAHTFLADHLQRFNQRDALRAERVDLFAISDALRFTHQAGLFQLRLCRFAEM